VGGKRDFLKCLSGFGGFCGCAFLGFPEGLAHQAGWTGLGFW
jgi:hypothetical protein